VDEVCEGGRNLSGVGEHPIAKGYAGRPVFVDLSAPAITEETPDAAFCRDCVSGTGLGLRAIELLGRNVVAAVEDGRNVDVREDMRRGATMAMSTGANAELGSAHAAAMPICALYHMPHGQAVSMLRPHVLACNARVVGDRIDDVFKAMGFGAKDGFLRRGLWDDSAGP